MTDTGNVLKDYEIEIVEEETAGGKKLAATVGARDRIRPVGGRINPTSGNSKYLPSLTCKFCQMSNSCQFRGADDDVCLFDSDLEEYAGLANVRSKEDITAVVEELLAVDLKRWRRGIMLEATAGGWPSKTLTSLGQAIERRLRTLSMLKGFAAEGASKTVLNYQAEQLATVAERITERVTERVIINGEIDRSALLAMVKHGPGMLAGMLKEEVVVDTGQDEE